MTVSQAHEDAAIGFRTQDTGEPLSGLHDTGAALVRERDRCILALAHGELCVSDLSGVVGLSESAVSHQLRLLRSLRIVRARRAGRQVYYQLDDAHIRTLLDQGRRHIEEARR